MFLVIKNIKKMTEAQIKAIDILKADKEKRNGFQSFPKRRLIQLTGINDEELFELFHKSMISKANGLNDTVITYLG